MHKLDLILHTISFLNGGVDLNLSEPTCTSLKSQNDIVRTRTSRSPYHTSPLTIHRFLNKFLVLPSLPPCHVELYYLIADIWYSMYLLHDQSNKYKTILFRVHGVLFCFHVLSGIWVFLRTNPIDKFVVDDSAFAWHQRQCRFNDTRAVIVKEWAFHLSGRVS